MLERNESRQKMEINNKLANMNLPLERLLNELKSEDAERRRVDREAGRRFLERCFPGWMDELRTAVREGSAHEAHSVKGMRVRFILYQLEHHFTPSHETRRVRNAYRYLLAYFDTKRSVAGRHLRFALDRIRRIELAQTRDIEKAGTAVRAWFGNRIWVVLMAIAVPKFKEYSRMMEMIFFLETIRDYFTESPSRRYFRFAYRYLRLYFRAYPLIRQRHSEKAMEMIGRLHQAIGYEFKCQNPLKPGLQDLEPENARRACSGTFTGISCGAGNVGERLGA